ncbi:LuxR C-terminal-related transcriptional regulator [Microbacterium helvum]|nr:LuxR C-terminal-related transcriptional regulator [Microbacterium helvum]
MPDLRLGKRDAARRAGVVRAVTGVELLGREREQSRLRDLLDDGRRFVAVTGRPGVGKTALLTSFSRSPSLLAAADVWRVDLDGVPATSGLFADVAGRLGIGGESARDGRGAPAERLARVIGGSSRVLVLDHADGGPLVADEVGLLLARCPRLRVVVAHTTSVEGVDGQVALLPLDVPDEGATVDEALSSAAVRLFVDRATGGDVHFRLDERSVDDVVRICRLVGGLPLALELAAARVRTLSLPRLARELDFGEGALDMLSARADAARGGMREALAGTVGALDARDRTLLESLSSFSGPFAFASATAVSGRPAGDVADALERLQDLRLLEAAGSVRDEPVFTMLPILRRFIAERGVRPAVRDAYRRHLGEVLADAAAAQARADRPSTCALAHVLRRDLAAEAERLVASDDDRAADWLVGCAAVLESEPEGALVGAQLERLIASNAVAALSVAQQARVWLWSAYALALTPDGVSLAAVIDERWSRGFALVEPDEDPELALQALMISVLVGITTGDMRNTMSSASEGRRIAIAHARGTWAARFDVWIAAGRHATGDIPGAVELALEALRHAERVADPHAIVAASILLHTVPAGSVPAGAAVPSPAEVLRLAQAERDAVREWFLLGVMTRVELAAGRPGIAARWCASRLSAGAQRGWSYLSAVSLIHSVFIAVAFGDFAFAGRILGAVEADRERVLRSMAPASRGELDRARVLIAERLGARHAAAAIAGGGMLSLAEAAAEAVPWLRRRAETESDAVRDDAVLTTREREVLELLADGLTNKEIAARLHITTKTTMHHTGSIYRKLDVRGRAEATAYAFRHGLVSRPPDVGAVV